MAGSLHVLQDGEVTHQTRRAGKGSLLTGSALSETLDSRVFMPGSWDPANVRGAGYDIRLSAIEMVVPAGRNGDATHYFGPQNPKQLPLIIEPGQTAVVSSEERLCLDFDIAGNIGVKFSLAAQGLLILTGMALDPGYGRQLNENGDWVPGTAERLHFVLANVGASPVSLMPGREHIAFLQLFDIERVIPSETPSLGWDALGEALFDRSSGDGMRPGGLTYFRNVKDLETRVERVERDVQEASSNVDKVEKASNYVVVFGVFLVAVTILGLALNALAGVIDRMPANIGRAQEVLIYAATGAYGLGVLALVWLAVRRTR